MARNKGVNAIWWLTEYKSEIDSALGKMFYDEWFNRESPNKEIEAKKERWRQMVRDFRDLAIFKTTDSTKS